MLRLPEIQLVIHVASHALRYHDCQGHGHVLIELLAIGVLEALDEPEAIAILLHTRATADLSSMLLGTFVAELLEAVLDRMLGGAEATGCNCGILAFTNENDTNTKTEMLSMSGVHTMHGAK